MQCHCVSDAFSQINSALENEMDMTAALKEVYALNSQEDKQTGMLGVLVAYHLYDVIAANKV